MWKKYDEEYKENAVGKIFDGQTVRSVSRELGVSEGLLHRWKRAALKNGNGSSTGEELSEIEELRKQNRELRMEVEILKKATLIFGRGS